MDIYLAGLTIFMVFGLIFLPDNKSLAITYAFIWPLCVIFYVTLAFAAITVMVAGYRR